MLGNMLSVSIDKSFPVECSPVGMIAINEGMTHNKVIRHIKT